MSEFYNAFGNFVSMSTIEGFAVDTKKDDEILKEIDQLKLNIESGKITKEQIITEIEKLNSLKENKDTSVVVKNAIELLVKNTVSKVDGIRFEGNMELSGIMKSRGYYLSDGTKVNEVTRVIDKLAVPLDKDGHVSIQPPKGKKVKATINELTVPKSGRMAVDGDIKFTGGNNWTLHTPDDKRHSLYITPSKTLGKEDWNWSNSMILTNNGQVTIRNPKNGDNPTGWDTHFNHKGKSQNYIRGKTEMRGETNFVDGDKGINITNKKNGNNPTGGGTHFNYKGNGLNYIRGKTEMAGDVNVVSNSGLKVLGHGKTSSFGSLNSGWCHITTNAPNFYMDKSLSINGGLTSYHNKAINVPQGISATGGRSYFKDAENRGRLRVGAAWGIPGLYSEDNQDIVIGCNGNRQVHLGRPNLVRIDKDGNLHLPAGKNVYIGGKAVLKTDDKVVIQSQRGGKYLRNRSTSGRDVRFETTNRGSWEQMKLIKL